MFSAKNEKILCCILGGFMLTLLQRFHVATYTMFGGGSGANSFTHMIYTLFGIISFVGVILVVIFSSILIISNINFKK